MSDFEKMGTTQADKGAVDRGTAFDWDSVIEYDGKELEYITMEEGEYFFQVESFDRGHFDGSAKMAACPMATVKLIFDYKGEAVPAQVRLFLSSKQEWKLSQFFRSIGQKQHGSKVTMNWNKVPGAVGWAHVQPREYNGKTYNDVKFFIDPEKAPNVKTQNTGFTI